jgi:hypothetical protein
MTTTSSRELRTLTLDAIRACAGIVPFALGTGHDSHGDPVPNAEADALRGLLTLVEVGRLAQVALEGQGAMAGTLDATPGDPE